MTQHDYKAALAELPPVGSGNGSYDIWARKNEDAIIHALKAADKMMQEPSEGMFEAGWNAFGEVDKKWIAMRDQMLKEVE